MIASWDVIKARQRTILLVTLEPQDLKYSGVYYEKRWDVRQKLPSGSNSTRLSGLPFGPARNRGVKLALDGGFAALAFLDSDVIPRDDNCFVQLMDTGLPIVGGLYHQKFHPYLPAFFDADEKDGRVVRKEVQGWKPGDLVPCAFLPTGLTLYRRELLEAAWARFKQKPFAWGMDTGPIPSDIPEEGGWLPSFSEDYLMSWRTKTVLGVQPYVATSVVGLHEGTFVVGPKWAVQGPDLANERAGVVGML